MRLGGLRQAPPDQARQSHQPGSGQQQRAGFWSYNDSSALHSRTLEFKREIELEGFESAARKRWQPEQCQKGWIDKGGLGISGQQARVATFAGSFDDRKLLHAAEETGKQDRTGF